MRFPIERYPKINFWKNSQIENSLWYTPIGEFNATITSFVSDTSRLKHIENVISPLFPIENDRDLIERLIEMKYVPETYDLDLARTQVISADRMAIVFQDHFRNIYPGEEVSDEDIEELCHWLSNMDDMVAYSLEKQIHQKMKEMKHLTSQLVQAHAEKSSSSITQEEYDSLLEQLEEAKTEIDFLQGQLSKEIGQKRKIEEESASLKQQLADEINQRKIAEMEYQDGLENLKKDLSIEITKRRREEEDADALKQTIKKLKDDLTDEIANRKRAEEKLQTDKKLQRKLELMRELLEED